LGAGRAKKLLAAFKQGRWREKILGAEDAPAASQPAGAALAPPGAPARRPQPNWYSFAFQPIIHAPSEAIFSYEALVRGKNQEPAGEILKQVHPDEMHRFDEQSRVQAIELAAHLGLQAHLNLNFLPLSAATSATAISSILETAGRCRIHPDQIILELLEREIIHDLTGFTAIVNAYRGSGLVFAIDDFGSGYSGLNLLAEFQPALIKLDMHLVRGIECKGPRQAIVRGIHRTCQDLGIDLIAEGVETAPEYRWLLHEGIEYFQGHLFAGPAFEQLPTSFDLPAG
jgi:EAL domain-containing protein (putative c-di-GMP-specific phosphodiesterase class I)